MSREREPNRDQTRPSKRAQNPKPLCVHYLLFTEHKKEDW